jgi:gluconolactonase
MELQQVEVLAEGLAFPEGPVLMPDGSVVVAEIRAGRLSRVDRDGNVALVANVGGGPNGAAIGPDGAIYVCNNGGLTGDAPSRPSIQRVDPETGQTEVIYTECDGQKLVGPNDLVFDGSGGFWFSDYRGNALYYALADGSFIRRADVQTLAPNGIGLSPDEDVLYWAETPTRQVWRRKLSQPGTLAELEAPETGLLPPAIDRWSLLVGLPGLSKFDSLAIEEGGAVCVGTLVDSGITVIQPDDGSYELYTLPAHLADPYVTNICFGGPDLQAAYITSSMNGRLISCRWPRPGLRLAYQQTLTG